MKTYEFEINEKTTQWYKNVYTLKALSLEDAKDKIQHMIDHKLQPNDIDYVKEVLAYEDIETVKYEIPDKGLNIKEVINET